MLATELCPAIYIVILLLCMLCIERYSVEAFWKCDKKLSRDVSLRIKKPNFSPADREEIQKMINSRRVQLGQPLVSDTSKPAQQKPPPAKKDAKPLTREELLYSPPIPLPSPPTPKQQAIVKPIVEPNANWRSALQTSHRPLLKKQHMPNNTPRKTKKALLDQSDDELYELFDQAEESEELSGFGMEFLKYREIEEKFNGLYSSEYISTKVWKFLVNHMGQSFSPTYFRQRGPIVFVFSEPRYLTDTFETILKEFAQVPVNRLNISLVAVNTEEGSEMRKFLRRNIYSFPILIDNTARFMKELKCISDDGMYSHCLAMLDWTTGKVLKVWYDGDWILGVTKDMIIEEVLEYTKDPDRFLSMQFGIR